MIKNMFQFSQIRKMSGYVQCLHRPYRVREVLWNGAAIVFDAFTRRQAVNSFVPVGKTVYNTF